MTAPASQPHLRLVAAEEGGARWVERNDRRDAVARENRAAAENPTLDPRDVRWVLAAHAHAQLQGTAMTPERRDRVIRMAERLGVRTFDANVIIAIVQDHARRGVDLADAVPTLVLVSGPAERRAEARPEWTRWIAAAACALAGSMFLIWWLLV